MIAGSESMVEEYRRKKSWEVFEGVRLVSGNHRHN